MSESDPVFLRACRGLPVPHTPVWLNRQAGRYMPEYHAVKGDMPSLEFFKNPERAARATLDAQRILGVDAAILFADLLPILEPMGMDLDYVVGTGPVFADPLRDVRDVERLRVIDAEQDTGYVAEAIERILADLPNSVGLIGFAGAPFTLASYAIEGGGSRNYVWVKKLMYEHPQVWDDLMGKLVDSVAAYVRLQIASGVHAIQLFDSWVGCLSPADYDRYVARHTRRLLHLIREDSIREDSNPGDVPIIYFGTGNSHLVAQMFATGPDVMAFDWRTPLRATWDQLGCSAVQGNLDPIVLCADQKTIASQAQAVLDEAKGRDGHIFNLGHGIIPETPVDNVKFLVDWVQENSAR